MPAAADTARYALFLLGAAALAASAAAVGTAWEVAAETRTRAVALTGGDIEEGRRLIRERGCGACHIVRGVPGAQGRVGPPLEGIADRLYIAGVMKNAPQALVDWIVDPPAIDPQTAMPVTGITRAEAWDVAAFLYTLR